MRWYFDFISPFAYLQSCKLQQLERASSHNCGVAGIEFKPVLFAGLLNHWGQLGPAELPSKRQWTFEHVLWLAHRDGIELKLPPHHPFNPIPLLRLCIAAGNTRDVVERLFRFVWVEGQVPQQDSFNNLCAEFGLTPDDINAPAIKQGLIDNGELAITDKVFGVPSIVVRSCTDVDTEVDTEADTGADTDADKDADTETAAEESSQLFWGYDATDMAIGYLQSTVDPDLWPKATIAQAARLEQGLQRKR